MSALRTLFRGAVNLPARLAYRGALAGLQRSTAKVPVVSFGGVLGDRKLLHGGAVKLLHLRDHFASDDRCFNLLYLVSSALPPFAEDLAHRCRELGIPLVWNQNGVGYPAWAGRSAEFYNAPMRRLRAQADFVIYQSIFCRESAEYFLGRRTAEHEILLNPVDLKKFHPGKPAPPVRLLTLGTHGYAERVLSTLDCLRSLRDEGAACSLTIAGRLGWRNGPEETRAHIEKLGLAEAVTVQPEFTQDEAAELYRGHHILLHPKYLDPCPTVVIEALASGLPVVGSASGGLVEMVPPSCGALIPVPLAWDRMITPDGKALARAVRSLLPRLPEASAAARTHAEKAFDGREWVARHGAIFNRLLS